jgi:hypothetical protein
MDIRCLCRLLLISLFLLPAARADTFDASTGRLTLASIQVGNTIYTDVVVTVGSLISVGGSHLAPLPGTPPPVVGSDTFDPYTGKVSLPSVQAGNVIFTDLVITVGGILGVGGAHPVVGTTVDPNPGGETWGLHNVAIGSQVGKLPLGVGSLIMSEVLILPSGTFRMYVGGRHALDAGGDIWMAESTDSGETWQFKGIVLAGSTNPSDPEFQIAGPSIVRLPDGRWRMYYQASPSFDVTLSGGPQPSFQMFSAISADGIAWTREGVRIANTSFDPNAVVKEAGHGRVMAMAGGYIAYFSANPKGKGNATGIYRMFSADGLTFQGSLDLVIADGHDPFVIKQGTQYLMYADLSPNSGGGSAQNGVLLKSSDGLTWSAGQPVAYLGAGTDRLHFGGTAPTGGIGDLSGVVMPNGKLRLFSNYSFSNIACYDLMTFP